MQYTEGKTGRAFTFSCNIYGNNGEMIINPEKVNEVLRRKSEHNNNLKWAYIIHDKDVYDESGVEYIKKLNEKAYEEKYTALATVAGIEKEEGGIFGFKFNEEIDREAKEYADKLHPLKKLGEAKTPHIHVVMDFTASKGGRKTGEIARWFGLPDYMMCVIKGRNGAGNMFDYLTHRLQTEKTPYSSDEVHSNFDYKNYILHKVEIETRHDRYRLTTDEINDIVDDIANKGMTLRRAEEVLSSPIFIRNKRILEEARKIYIKEKVPMPIMRQVFYVDGDGTSGIGKSTCAKGLCKQLALQFGATTEDIIKSIDQLKEWIFVIGRKGVSWQQYDGQPIVLIDDRTASDMLFEMGGHQGVKTLLDPYPEKESVNIKYGDVCIVAQYIVINGIQPWQEFLNGLNGTYVRKDGVEVESDTDVNQYYRRCTGVIVCGQDYFEVMFNKGVLEGTMEYNVFMTFGKRRCNWLKMKKQLSGEALLLVEGNVHRCVIEQSKKIIAQNGRKISDTKALPKEFLEYGEELPETPVEPGTESFF